ncbi:MAG: hypothetical protein ACYTCU_09260 [Planctomycetota bacterium]
MNRASHWLLVVPILLGACRSTPEPPAQPFDDDVRIWSASTGEVAGDGPAAPAMAAEVPANGSVMAPGELAYVTIEDPTQPMAQPMAQQMGGQAMGVTTTPAYTAPTVAPMQVTHGMKSRARTAQLDGMIESILAITLPEVSSMMSELELAVTSLAPPERLATNQPVLKLWRAAKRAEYQATVDFLYGEARTRLQNLYDVAVATATDQARTLAAVRSPLDVGATGDPALDTTVETFSEVLQGAIGLSDLDTRHSQDAQRRRELFETFTTFAVDGAEESMQGRILLFTGGDESRGSPRALLAFRVDDGTDPATRSMRQVMRARIMRGTSVVTDFGWKPSPVPGQPGLPKTEILENFLIAPIVEPSIRPEAAGFDQLRDYAIRVDLQSGVYDADGVLLGGVDWRVVFRVSARGGLTWELEGQPQFDPYCREIGLVMGG